MAAAILFISLAVFIFLNIPISISLGLSSALTLMATGSPLGVIPSMMQATVQKFSLLTIPLFCTGRSIGWTKEEFQKGLLILQIV